MRYTISLLLASVAAPAMAQVNVVTDIPPVQSLVAQVMGQTPAVLLPPGADAHSFQMRPSQAQSLADADLVIWVGPEMTPWLGDVLKSVGGGQSLELIHADGVATRSFAEEHHDHDHDHGHEGHDHSGTDPHAWLDPANASVWLDAIAAELAKVDPDNAATYADNAAAGKERIASLDAELKAQLDPIKASPFVVFHDAYGYFADHYGLTVAGAVSAGDASSPSVARLTEVRAAAGDAVCLFPEVQHDPKLVAQMAEDGGVTLGEPLDPEGSALQAGPELYADLMRGLATTLTDCLNR